MTPLTNKSLATYLDEKGEKGSDNDGEPCGSQADLEKNHKAKDGLKNHRERRSCEVNRSSSEKK